MGEVIPRTEYLVKFSDKEYRLMAACVAKCAGITGTSVSPKEANELNVMLVESRTRYLQEQTAASEKALAKAKTHEVPDD